jgi:hypothetical protein
MPSLVRLCLGNLMSLEEVISMTEEEAIALKLPVKATI